MMTTIGACPPPFDLEVTLAAAENIDPNTVMSDTFQSMKLWHAFGVWLRLSVILRRPTGRVRPRGRSYVRKIRIAD